MPTSTAFISAQGLTRRFPDTLGSGQLTVFEDLWFNVAEGEFACVIGHSGCGKSTILNILAGLDAPTEGHIIAAGTLAIPVLIVSETSLSFLGLGIRPPAISWGVLLQEAQNIQTVADAPWLLIPCLFVIIAVLAFNLVGDGLRDAADPYGH